MLAETKERGYSSWIDGTISWLVAYDPNATADPTCSSSTANRWMVGTNVVSAKSLGIMAQMTTSGTTRYMPATAFVSTRMSSSSPGGMAWGPSSDHTGGNVVHVFADGHTSVLTDDIEPNMYLSLTSRNSSEQITGDY